MSFNDDLNICYIFNSLKRHFLYLKIPCFKDTTLKLEKGQTLKLNLSKMPKSFVQRSRFSNS